MPVIERNDDSGPLFVRLDGVYFQRASVRPGPQPRGNVVEAIPTVGPSMDAHDDEIEARLLDRIERDGLLPAGMTASDVRAALDA